ncbi:MAG: hypothetical protein QF775_01600 [archaeon]|nr:hypothetical protein [archaeon]
MIDEICEDDIPFHYEFTEKGKALVAIIYKEHREELKKFYTERIEELMKSGEGGPEIAPLFLGLIGCYTDAFFH